MIRKANKNDISTLLEIYDQAHQIMIDSGNPTQWPSYYPGLPDIEEDMENDVLYVYEHEGKVIGVFAFIIGIEPTYSEIEGKWDNDYPYGFIHRIAAFPNDINFGDKVIEYCKSKIGHLRVDTHHDNAIMKHLLEKNGFSYKGVIYVHNDSPRDAYEWDRYQKIYIAGGCFWGVEHYYSLLKGVISTKVGYANGDIENPSYEQVKHHEASHAETVEVVYDPEVISLEKILEHFLRFVDPYSIDKQGEDSGHQYRSGIYYIDNEYNIIKGYFDKHIQGEYQIEILKLENFYDAEEYHQDYLYKNPTGYCHVNMRLIKDEEKK